MSRCVQCGGDEGASVRYARVLIEHETKKDGRKSKSVTRETLVGFADIAVCPSCAKKAKRKAVLMTIPITLVLTVVLTFLGFFAVRPNRNAKKEIASLPTVVPAVAAMVWLCGLSVYLPRPPELYAAELARKCSGDPGSMVLLPLEARCYTQRKSGDVKAADVCSRTAVKTELAEMLVPLIRGQADDEYAHSLTGRTFSTEKDPPAIRL